MKSLIPWYRRTESPLEQLREEMDTLFHRFFPDAGGENGGGPYAWAPRVDLEEGDKEIVVKADLPGVDPTNVEVTVANDMLTIRGEKKEEREEKKKNFHRTERFVGQFYRSIPLPAGADADKVAAEASKGVISIRIPKKPEVQAKKIAVAAKE